MQEVIARVAWPDMLAPVFFLLCWAGYALFADGPFGGRRSLMARIHQIRRVWMRRMLTRENRIGDMQVVMILAQSNAFFASTAILIVGGCLAILGSRDQAMTVLNTLPGVAATPLFIWELKVLLLPRDPLDINRQLDRWSQLGVPLMVTLSAPSSQAADPRALHPARPLPELSAEKLSPKWQQNLIEWLLPMVASKPMVQAIVWDAWQDNAPHEFAHSGLLDAKGKSKPALQTMIDLRRDSIG